MATLNSKDMGFWFTGNATSVLVNLSGQVNSQSIELGITVLDDTGLGDTQHEMVAGLAAAPRVPVNGRLNSTVQATLGSIAQGTSVAKTAQLKNGATYYNGTALLENYQESGNIDTLMTWSGNLVFSNGANKTSVAL